MAYRLVEHTADLGFEAWGLSLDELFAECLKALTDSMTCRERVGVSERRSVELAAADLERLLVDWLTEAIYLQEAEGLVFSQALVEVRGGEDGWRLTGELRGERFDPKRHGFKTLIKAATYHQLSIRRVAEGWRAHVILDI